MFVHWQSIDMVFSPPILTISLFLVHRRPIPPPLFQWRADEAARQQQSFWYRTAKVTTGRSCAWFIVVAVLAAAVPVAYQVRLAVVALSLSRDGQIWCHRHRPDISEEMGFFIVPPLRSLSRDGWFGQAATNQWPSCGLSRCSSAMKPTNS